jgi:type III secretion protein SpaR/YscT/HrcT
VNTSLFFDVSTWMLGATLGMARVGPIFFMLPFFNSSVLSGATRTAVILIISLGFWPLPMEAMAHIETSVYIAAIAQELFVGVVLGGILAWPFWIFHAVGGFIDNQRGATLSSTIDPANGIDTSELSNFFNVFCTAIYLQSGGMLKFVEAVSDSYRLCDPLQGCNFAIAPLMSLLNSLLESAIILASPVIAGLLLSEFTLGLLSRFTPQLNAFSISLTVKSVVTFFILLIYFSPLSPDQISHFFLIKSQISFWFKAR